MLILTNAGTDSLELVTDSAATLDVHASWVDSTGAANSSVTPGRTNTAISSAATTSIVATPAAGTYRNVKSLVVRNKHATLSDTVTIRYNANATTFEVYKTVLAPGDTLIYLDGVGFSKLPALSALLNVTLRVANDVVNATTSFADITGLTYPMVSGHKYFWEAWLLHQTNATTTAAFFGFNIGAVPTASWAWGANQIASSVTAAGFGSVAAVTARDTAILTAGTTGPGAASFMANLGGYIQPSADGTFALRCASEVAIAAGLTVKAGSVLRIRETDN